MNSLKLLFVLLITISIAKAQAVKFSSDQPEAGTKVSFTYDPAGTALKDQENITCRLYTFYSTANPVGKAIDLVKDGSIYKGEFNSADSTTLIGLRFSNDDDFDGYILQFTKQSKVLPETYLNEGNLLGLNGKYYLGIPLDQPRGLALYKKAFELKPELKEKNLQSYLSLELQVDQETGTTLINENLSRLSKIENPSEKDLSLSLNLYNQLKKEAEADSVGKIILNKYPNGKYAYNEAFRDFYKEADPLVREQKATELISKFNLNDGTEENADKLSMINSLLASSFSEAQNNEKFEFYANKIDDKLTRASLYNQNAWPSAEENRSVDFASKISKKSLDLVEQAKNDEVPTRFSNRDEYIKNLNSTYGMYADTYALLLYRQGNFKDALAMQEKAIANFTREDPEILTRRVIYLVKNAEYEKAFNEAERLTKEGMGSDTLKSELKDLYVILKKEGSFETYWAGVENIAKEKKNAELMQKMINIPAPAFSLNNLKGEKVSLSDFKGKMVVLDYWATWCGPCIASFPGMQKAIAKYADNPNVVFLFVNTWEDLEGRETKVDEFITKNKYSFNVLYDTPNVKDPDTFDVVSAYKVSGIPTKFFIDGEGNIRYKSVGFSGSDDGVVKEIDALVDLLVKK
ncbi:redoxin domain-containing protein [Sphingobacterium hungaricum]